MGSYFHVIERKVGGNLDAFRRELGRLRESGHFHRDRHERIMRIAKTVGFGHIVRQCLVDTGHRAGCEVHVLTSTGIVFVFNAHSRKLITVLVARPGQVAAAKSGRVFIYPYVIDTLEVARELWPDLPSRSMDSLRDILGIERTDAHRALADCYDELALLNAELSVIMQSYARKMDYCRSELLHIAGEIAEEIGE